VSPGGELLESLSPMETVYEQFIHYCKEIEESEISSGIYLETHHIVPRHCGGTNDSDNLIKLSRKNHILAHFYRWISYESQKDRIAYYFMCGDPDGTAKREAGRLAQQTWTPEKRSAASKKAYQTMLERGTGVANRSESWRQNVSKSARKRVNNLRKHRMTGDSLSLMTKTYWFNFSGKTVIVDQKDFDNFLETSKYLCNVFGLNIKESEHKKFIRLVKGERKVFHGITIDKVISSQAVPGTEQKVQRLEAESRTDSNASTSALQP